MTTIATVTRPAEFVFQYADLSPIGTRRERLFRNYMGQQLPEQYIKVLRPLGSTVWERTGCKLFPYTKHVNVEGEDLAVLGGDMLRPDTATFLVAYFGLTELGYGYRYVRYVGIEAAEKAILRWAKRKFVTFN